MLQLQNPFKNAKLYRYPYGDVVQLFGESPELYSAISTLGIKGHNGWDIYQPHGTPLLAVFNGTVVDIKNDPNGYGRHIRLMSDWVGDTCYEATYGHLAEIQGDLRIGDRVIAGEQIGTCGNTGFVVSQNVAYWGGSNPDKRGTHLHFGVREFVSYPTGWTCAYLGKIWNVKNYKNDYCGAVDPMPFFEAEINKQAQSVIELAKRVIKQVRDFLKL